MQLTPEQIQGVLELEPKAQIDRLQGERPYIRTGYWNRQRDLNGLNAGLAKLGLKADEIDDYDEDTGWLYWYELSPLTSAINESKEEVEYLMGKFYEYRMLAAEAGANGADAEYKDFSDRAMEYYERAMGEMDADAAEAERNDKMVADYEEDDANREMNRADADLYERFTKLANIKESSTDFDTYKVGDQIELDPKYFEAYQFPEGYTGVVKYIDKADYADETPVYTVKIKNIDPTGDEYDEMSVEYKQVK
jgi:hypothetical protein